MSGRPFAGLFASVLQLTTASGAFGCEKLARQPTAAVAGIKAGYKCVRHNRGVGLGFEEVF